jgi:hypothetical protein
LVAVALGVTLHGALAGQTLSSRRLHQRAVAVVDVALPQTPTKMVYLVVPAAAVAV